MNGALQVIGFILNAVGYICVILTTALPEWRRNDPSGEVLETIIRHQGNTTDLVNYCLIPVGLFGRVANVLPIVVFQ